jgi:signal transduction histidine kinase
MDRKILSGFLKDKAPMIAAFFLNTLLLALFYSLSAGVPVELLYPLAVSSFLFLVLSLIEWVRYSRFNRDLQNCIENASYKLSPSTWEQKAAAEAINGIHKKYLQEIADIRNSNKERQHFLSQWIHNMKAPVSVTDLILRKMKGEEWDSPVWGHVSRNPAAGSDVPDLLADLGEENKKLDNMLDQVLNLLRLEDFAGDYVPEQVDLAASVKNVINARKSQFIYSNVFPRLEYAGDEMTVLSDRKWNELMIGQIVSNAIKYSHSASAAERAPETKNKCILFTIERQCATTFLTIKDEGIGIPSYDLKRIFEPFFTGENGRKSGNATGIGLYIASAVAKKLGHGIRIESDAGKGTSVIISYLSKL